MTKLLEHIAQLEREKSESQMAANERLLTASAASETESKMAQLALEKSESSKKIIALENAYKLLKEKHIKLVDTHANLLRSTAANQSEFDKIKNDKQMFVTFKANLYKYIVESGKVKQFFSVKISKKIIQKFSQKIVQKKLSKNFEKNYPKIVKKR